jgi:predicted DNA-binding transcriptional regulator YafY
VESPAARLLNLLSLLQSRPRWSATELAERLSVTPRTVRRDVTRLRDLGYPVNAELGRDGGYTLGAGGALPPLLLTDDEAVAVAIGLRAAATGGVAGYDDAAIAALVKLEQVLPARLRERVLALSTSTVLVPSAGERLVDPEVLLILAQGCHRAERLGFSYRDASGNDSDRRVEPYGLVNVEGRWYLVTHDLDRDDWRTFRVDRMREPRLTGHRFVKAAEPDVATMVVEGIAVAAYDWQAEVLLHASLDEAAAEIPRTVGTLERIKGGTLLRMGASELDWIARYISGLPFDADVIDPPELRAALRAHGRRLQHAHRDG